MTSDLKIWLNEIGEIALSGEEIDDMRDLLDGAVASDEADIEKLLKAARLLGLAGSPRTVFERALIPAATSGVAHVAALVAACFASVRIEMKARPDATLIRQDLSKLADAAYAAAGEQSVDAVSFCLSLSGIAIEQISQKAATLSPVLQVETGVPIPSSLAAYDLYGDAGRGHELIERNRHATPLLMPVIFEAVAQ